MDRAWLNDIAKRPRINPTDVLKEIGPLKEGVDRKVRGFRAPRLKRKREIIEACLFCFGLSCRMERPVWVVDHEAFDYDFVAVSENNGNNFFAPTQLKEVVPNHLNQLSSVQSVIDKVAHAYPASPDLTVAIRINRHIMLDLDRIDISRLSVAALWLYGASSRDGSHW